MHNKLLTLYPNAPEGSWELMDESDGDGPYISRWDELELGPQPSKAAIMAVDATVVEEQIVARRELADVDLGELLDDIVNALPPSITSQLSAKATLAIAKRKAARLKL